MGTNKVLVAQDIDSSNSTFGTITEGQVAFLTETATGTIAQLGNGLDIADYPKVHIVRGGDSDNGPKIFTLEGLNVSRWSFRTYSAGAKKTIVIGYSGSGTNQCPINVYNDYDYHLRIKQLNVLNDRTTDDDTGTLYHAYSGQNFVTDSLGRYKILSNLLMNVYNDDDRIVNPKIRMSETITAFAANATVVNGSKNVTITSHGRSAGDFVFLGGTTYRIESVTSANVFVLDRPYEETSGTVKYNVSPPTASTIAPTNGSTTVSCDDTTNTTTIAAGDFISMDNVTYKVVSVVTDTSFTIDRPYEGATSAGLTLGTVPQADYAVLGSAGYIASGTIDDDTYFGLSLEAKEVGIEFTADVEDGFDGGEVITEGVLLNPSGLYATVAQAEKDSDPEWGRYNNVYKAPDITRYAQSGEGYYTYTFTVNNKAKGTAASPEEHDNWEDLTLYLDTDATIATKITDYLGDWLGTTNGQGNLS